MNFEIVQMPAILIEGKELRTTFKNNVCYKEIPKFWQEQHQANIWKQIPEKVYPDVIIGLYTNYSSDISLTGGTYSLIVGCPVKSYGQLQDENPSLAITGRGDRGMLQNKMVVKEIPAAKYAVFTAQGPFATAITKTWQEIWNNKSLQRTFENDFEWYDAQSTDDAKSIVKIYVGIK